MTSVFSDSLAGWPGRRQLPLALGASLLLHLGALAVLQRTLGPAADVAPVLGSAAAVTSGVLVTLRGSAKQGTQDIAGAPDGSPGNEATEAGATRAAGEEGTMAGEGSEQPAATQSVESPVAASAARLVARGQRRLAESLPPYPAQPFVPASPTGPAYFRASELTVAAALLDEPLINPPADGAGDALLGGKVVLSVFLAADGAVARVEVASSSLPPAYGDAAVAAFSRLRFRPGEIQGVAVSSESRYEVEFKGGEAGSSHASDRKAIPSSAIAAKPQ
ncbi:TonB family protein [Accumulibacter sp.]|uniref:TonB family protein n=1 Tax=Accumulibacter sp. TaxID=2053492 RepID=UPI0035AF9141